MVDPRPHVEALLKGIGEPSEQTVSSARERLTAAMREAAVLAPELQIGDSAPSPVSCGTRRWGGRTTAVLLVAASVIAAIAVPALAFRHPGATRPTNPVATRPPTTPSVTTTTLPSTRPIYSGGSCPGPTVLNGWATALSADGRTAWSDPLLGSARLPASEDEEAVFGDGEGFFPFLGVVHAIGLADGKPRWSWVSPLSIEQLWAWQGIVVVLSDGTLAGALRDRLTALDDKSGAVLWSLTAAGRVSWNQILLPDGGLAWQPPGELQVVDVAEGRVRWSRVEASQSALSYADGLVIAQQGSALSGYSAGTGERQWLRSGLSPNTTVQVSGSLVLLVDGGFTDHEPFVSALDPLSGRRLWRFSPYDLGYVQSVTSGPAGLLVFTTQRSVIYLLDPRLGTVKWQESTLLGGPPPLVLSHDIVDVETATYGPSPVWLVDRNAQTGRVRWRRVAGTQPTLLSGSLLVGIAPGSTTKAAAIAYRLSDGGVAWRTGLPDDVLLAPQLVGGRIVTQPATAIPTCNLRLSGFRSAGLDP
jgi:outer membrane protein assembly factor BamB